jgi:purine-cytosine permease-like protein
LAIIACFGIICAGFLKFDFSKEFDSFLKLVSTFLGIVGLALGYLFGAKDHK